MRRWVFRRHSNPWSAWTRWLTTPLVLVPIWNRDWRQGAVVAAWLAANPVVFPEPRDDRAFATRAMLGEELWVVRRPRDAAMASNAAGMALGVLAVVAARRRRLGLTVVATVAEMALLMFYWRQMAAYYDENHGTGNNDAAEVA
ncbi:DUF6653 family protein [Amycolatopsis sp. NPDC058986]|uniref:DUF6653 family protein n=1 Tax=unclassified Amycolatopsis TaxID=2618356 RepID=UPI003672597E